MGASTGPPRPLPGPVLVLAAVLALAALAPAAAAADPPGAYQLQVVAREAGCSADRTFCFVLLNGTANLTHGEVVNLTLVNEAGNRASHNAFLTQNKYADPQHQDTPADAAFANTSTIPPGANTSVVFTVPSADALYLWCDVTGHEAAGMWDVIHLNTTASNATGNDTNGTGNGTGGNGTAGNSTNGTGGSSGGNGGAPGNGGTGYAKGNGGAKHIPAPGVLASLAMVAAALVLAESRGRGPRRGRGRPPPEPGDRPPR